MLNGYRGCAHMGMDVGGYVGTGYGAYVGVFASAVVAVTFICAYCMETRNGSGDEPYMAASIVPITSNRR